MNRLTQLGAHSLASLSTSSWQQHWDLAGWTMCYFFVCGTGVALGGALLLHLCRRARPQLRYLLSLALFATLAALPVGIVVWLSQGLPIDFRSKWNHAEAITFSTAVDQTALSPKVIDLKDELVTRRISQRSAPVAPVRTTLPSDSPAVASNQPALQATSFMVTAIGSLPWLWIVGTPLTFLLLTTGLIGSQRLRQCSTPTTAGPLCEVCQRLRVSLQIPRQVTIAVCERIASPLLVGVVRPLILLPPAALTGWSLAEIEMVLLHELAHVRRWDNLVNFWQRIVESLLFFHPAIWWASRQVRRDREECCDAVVVAHTAQPQAYAELLVALAAPNSPVAGLAMAEHPLAGRIRRILKLEDEKMLVSRSALGIAGLLMVVVAASLLLWQQASTIVAQEAIAKASDVTSLTTAQDRSTKLLVASDNDGPLENTSPPSPFLSLKDQRAADLAYKLLGVELEPLSQAELERVKMLEYGGGLRVAAVNDDLYGGGFLAPDDLLVGLHVWPLTSLQDVVTVLQRGDITELSPLKFHVIRLVASVRGSGEDSLGSDELVTGRINVDTATIKQQLAANGNGSLPIPAAKTAPTLLYDGKTFAEWRELWKYELSTKKRSEAIRALAAFARAGYGKEAAQAILDVAGEYDFYQIDQSDEGRLKSRVLEVLSTNNDQRIATSLWLDDLLQRHAGDHKKWHWLAYHAISRMENQSFEDATYQVLHKLVRGDTKQLRRAAVEALSQTNSDESRTSDLAEELVAADDPEVTILGLDLAVRRFGSLRGGMAVQKTEIRSMPALLAALRHPSSDVCRAARGKLKNLSEDGAKLVVIAIMKALEAAETEALEIKAIRALAATGEHGSPATVRLRDLIEQEDSEAILIAAAVALSSHDENRGLPTVLEKITGVDLKNRQGNFSRTKLEKYNQRKLAIYNAFELEEQAIFPQETEQAGGGAF